MPPKLSLNVNASINGGFKGSDQNESLYAPSIEVMPGGALKLFKSYQAYEFAPGGMTRDLTSPLAAGAAAMHQSYKISEQDVRVVKLLGSGASGIVQKAFIPRESRFVAVKKISVLERDKRHQLMNDIKALCNAPDMAGLIKFFGAYLAADKGQVAVVLEYIDGGSLADVLQKVKRIPEDTLAGITAKILAALANLHARHMVHRDIKPANILMSTSGDPKVSDFGISAFMDNTIAQCHTFLGTVTYMSPERINGQPYSFPADIWALGLTLLECATGAYPYDASGGTIQLMIQLMEDECPLPPEGACSPEFRDFVAACMRKDPWARPSAEALLAHPFLAAARPAPDLRGFMACMYDRAERVSDAVWVATSRFYNNLAYNYADSDSIAVFYAPDAVLQLEGEQRLKGRYTIAGHFHALMRGVAALGDIALAVDSLEQRPVEGQDDLMLQEVQTRVRVVLQGSPSGGGAAGSVLGVFADTFVVRLDSLESSLPGVGYTFQSQSLQWIQQIQIQATRKLGGSQKCRVQ